MTPHYLPLDAFHWLMSFCKKHPMQAAFRGAFAWLVMAGFFRWRLRRWGSDVLVVGLIAAALLILIGACLFLLKTRGGYQWLGTSRLS